MEFGLLGGGGVTCLSGALIGVINTVLSVSMSLPLYLSVFVNLNCDLLLVDDSKCKFCSKSREAEDVITSQPS